MERRLSSSQKKHLIISFIACFFVQCLFIAITSQFRLQKETSGARIYGQALAASMEAVMEKAKETTELTEIFYEQYGQQFLDNFQTVCRDLTQDQIAIGSIYFAPVGIIKYAYPDYMTGESLGFNLLMDPSVKDKVNETITSRTTKIDGPVILTEGGVAFVMRNPVFIDGVFQAIACASVKTDAFISQSLAQMEDEQRNQPYTFAVKKESDSCCVNEFGYILYNSDSPVSSRLAVTVHAPGENWQLYVQPKGGWLRPVTLLPEYITAVIVSALFLTFMYLYLLHQSRKNYLMEHDELTGLLTRSAFHSHLRKLFRENPGVSYDLLVADIENFKVINSLYTPVIGDAVLRFVAQSLESINVYGFTGRYGADKFIMVFPTQKRHSTDVLIEENQRILEDCPVDSLNIKYGLYGEVDKSEAVNILCDRALIAARSIMHNYSKTIEFYEGDISNSVLRAQMLESAFETGISRNQFQVWYQPKYDCITEKLVGAEALVRWKQEDGTFTPPGSFIPVFEDDGLIVRLDEYIFRTVCEQVRYLLGKFGKTVPVSVNISRISLSQNGAVKKYAAIVDETKVPIEYVPLEITESASTANKDIKDLAQQLKDEGFSIHMDDFGTGLSSLESINIMPFDVVKLDKSLIDYIGDLGGNELLRHVVEMAHFKNMKVLAEGVERREQLDFLKELDCNFIQGFYFSKPLPFEEWEDLLSCEDKI